MARNAAFGHPVIDGRIQVGDIVTVDSGTLKLLGSADTVAYWVDRPGAVVWVRGAWADVRDGARQLTVPTRALRHHQPKTGGAPTG